MKPLQEFFDLLIPIIPILQATIKAGGQPYVVGGTVRDLVMGEVIKDLDIEVHKLSMEQLEFALSKFGKVAI